MLDTSILCVINTGDFMFTNVIETGGMFSTVFNWKSPRLDQEAPSFPALDWFFLFVSFFNIFKIIYLLSVKYRKYFQRWHQFGKKNK